MKRLSLEAVRGVHLLWLSIFLVTAVLQATGLEHTWQYDRRLISEGHYWLLLSCHLVHLNWTHWALNMGGLAIVAWFFSAYGNLSHWLAVLVVSSLFVGLGLYWLNPTLITYVGLSGVLHGLFVYGALGEIRRYPLSGYVLLALLVGKLVWEAVSGPMPGSEHLSGGRVITDAHLYGAIGGSAVGIVRLLAAGKI